MALKKPKQRKPKLSSTRQSAEISRLKAIIEEKDKEIHTLTEISKSIVSGRYISDVLNIIVSLTADMMGSKICSIMAIDRDKQELKIIATQSLSEEYRKKGNVKIGTSISGRAVIDKKPVAVEDVTKEPGYMFKEIAAKEGLVSMLAVPMILKDRIIGVLNIYTDKKHVFSEGEIKVIQTVANQAAIGIENEKLCAETAQVKDALEARKMIDRAKGILMARFKITEDAAYKTIHKKSMNSRKSMKEVSEAIILAAEIEAK
ncbi:MAG TPA: GAF domain-containing protein [Candidatus Goldiibacteriota bacterium]|nr:GAF domain-containing protein [Candidatus Goldiibacteriota bacterium]